MSDYNRILTLGLPAGANVEGEKCPDCGRIAELRRCGRCGCEGWIIDCGHYAQPRPLASGRDGCVGGD